MNSNYIMLYGGLNDNEIKKFYEENNYFSNYEEFKNNYKNYTEKKYSFILFDFYDFDAPIKPSSIFF